MRYDIDAQVVIAFTSIDLRTAQTSCCCCITPTPSIVVISIGIDGDEIVTGASINVGIKCTKGADIALPGCVGVDEQAVVTGA